MKRTILLVFTILMIISCTNLNENEKTLKKDIDTIFVKEFTEFNRKDIGKSDTVNQYSKIKIQRISSKDIKQLCSKTKVTCLIFWAPWCNGCCKALKGVYKEIIEEYKSDATFVLISISDNLAANQKELFVLPYFSQTYSFDSSLYKGTSTDDFPKLRKFLDELFPGKKLKHYIPLMIMINQKQELLAFDPMYKEEIERIIKKGK